jgi:hypothetical protein
VDPYSPGVFLISETVCLSCSGIGTMSLPKCARVKFLGGLAILQKVTIRFVLSVLLSVHPHGTTWLPLSGFS